LPATSKSRGFFLRFGGFFFRFSPSQVSKRGTRVLPSSSFFLASPYALVRSLSSSERRNYLQEIAQTMPAKRQSELDIF
jgi:hypothetical protein